MKFLISLSALVLILSIFTNIEAKRSKKMPFFRKKIQRQASAGGSSMSSGNSNFGRSSFSHANTQRSLSSRDPSADLKHKEEKLPKKPVSTMGVSKTTVDKSSPTGVTYGPRGGNPGVVSGTRYIGGPRPRAYGYYTGRFPIWLTSYAVVTRTLENCPPTNERLEFAQKSFGVCMMICDREHCIQTANYCCYYVEPKKYMAVRRK